MSNRSQEVAREIEFSASTTDGRAPTKPRHDDGWRSDYEAELSKYFSGDYHGDAGLRSGFGAQLEKARDGVSFCVQGFREMPPPRGIELGPSAHGLDVGRVVGALLRLPDVALEAARDRLPKKDGEPERELTEDEALAAYDVARHHIGVLGAYYRKHPVGAYQGLVGLEPFAMACPLTAPIVRATKAWMRAELEKELAHAASAAALSGTEAEKRIAEWRAERANLTADLEAYESDGEERTRKTDGEAVVFLGVRRSAQRRLDELDATIAAATRTPERIDVAAIVRGKWEREPTYDELRQTLRKANEDSKRLKIPETRDAAKRMVAEAMSAAKRDLGAARMAYAAARREGRKEKADAAEAKTKRRLTKKEATIIEYDDRHGLR